MHEFVYKGSVLNCEDMSIKEIADEFPTPFYLYSYKTIMQHLSRIKDAFRDLDPLICFSMKSNSNLSICKALVNAGCGLDIVSGGELFKAKKINCPSQKIVYASVGKTREEIKQALQMGILFFNVESVPELIMIDTVAGHMGKKANVAIRINPDIRPDTHDYITTGAKEKKFGLDFSVAEDIFDNANKYSNVELKGIHLHIGSQITDPEPFVEAIKKVLAFVEKSNINIEWLNIGGGFGIVYNDEKASTAEELAQHIVPLLEEKPLKLILEPGRFIMGNAGVLVTKVLYVKQGATGKNFAIVDAGMNDLLRPTLYHAYHKIVAVTERQTEHKKYDIVGPICESGDYLGLERNMQELLPGELLAVMGAGAYGFSMASNYNSRPRVAELMVINGQLRCIRGREKYKDLIRSDKVIKELK